MRNISKWAKHHAPAAIAFIIIIQVILFVLAMFVGKTLGSMDYNIPFVVFVYAVFAFIILACIYPSRHHSMLTKKKFFAFQKSLDFTLALCTFIMIGTLANNNFRFSSTTQSIASNSITTPPTAEEILASLQYRDKSSLTKSEKKILKQEFKKQIKVIAKAKITGDKKKANKGLFIVLAIIGALGLFYVLAFLVCNLSCSGAAGAATVVAIVGLVAIIWATIAVIRFIIRGTRKKETRPEELKN